MARTRGTVQWGRPWRSPRALRDDALVLAVLAVVVALEAWGLRAGAIGVIVVAFAGLLALAAIVFRVDLALAGVFAACAASCTLTWNGWFVGPLRPGDVLILVALFCFALARTNDAFRTPPWWVKQLVLAIILVVIAQIYFPPDPVYMSQRVVLTAQGDIRVTPPGSLAELNITVGIKFIIAVAAIPMAFAAAVRVDRRAVRWLIRTFAGGAAVSGWVAIVDRFGAGVGTIFTGKVDSGGRQFGLSDHPNYLAAGMVLALPFAFWLIFDRDRTNRIIGAIALPGMLLGVYTSGSRGGSVTALIVLVLCVALHPRTRVYTVNVAVGGLVLVGGIVAVTPQFGAAILDATRLGPGASTSGSDSVRATVGAQGVRDFFHSPIAGLGLQISDQASQVYLQELASGGLILFIGMSLYMLGGLISANNVMRRDTIGVPLIVAFVGTLILNFVEADLTDRFYYVPGAILIAVLEKRRLDAESEQTEDGDSVGVPALGVH